VNQKWNLLLDDEDDDDVYLTAYDDVCEYGNKQHSSFNQYQLPYHPVLVGDDEIETEDGTLYSSTPTEDWTRVNIEGHAGRLIDPIEWTGGNEEFSVKITDEDVNMLKDDHDEIRYEKVFEWYLPQFGDDDESLFEFQAARMCNYMRRRIVEDGWMPKYYIGNRVITADHVTRFYGAYLAKMFMGNRSINSFQAIVPLTEHAKGVLFLWEHISLKNWSFCPLLRDSTSLFKSTCLIIRLK
jgi:hypothetical protein